MKINGALVQVTGAFPLEGYGHELVGFVGAVELEEVGELNTRAGGGVTHGVELLVSRLGTREGR